MSVTAPPTRSNVVVHQSASEPVLGVAVQLLGILGHAVTLAPTPEAALAFVAGRRTDLLVLRVSDPAEQDHCLDRLAMLPPDRRPRQVAILTDADTDAAPLLQRRLPGVKVRVLVASVHALGLLDVIKRLDATRN